MTTYRSVNEALPVLAHLLLTEGADVPSRAGATKELTFQHFTITDPLQREIVLPGRKANIAAQIAETMWVLGGRNDVEWLSAYLPRAADFSDDGETWRAGYGPRLREWKQGWEDVDQFTEVINLLLEDPTTRRAVMSIWDPATDYQSSKDIPCNNWLHFLSRDGVLDLHVAIRSNDLVWGWSGINQFEWSTLLEVVAAYTGLKVGRIHYAVSSLHMYDRHWDKAPTWKNTSVHTERDRRFDPHELGWDLLCDAWFGLEKHIRDTSAKRTGWDGLARLIADFPEPMLRSWLWVLAWWWSGDEGYLTYVQDSRLWHAAQVGTGPRKEPVVAAAAAPATLGDVMAHVLRPGGPASRLIASDTDEATQSWDHAMRFPGKVTVQGASTGRLPAMRQHPSNAGRFVAEVCALHLEKDAAYGTSWKKRGELFSILPNIARKVDRLGSSDTTDENQTDTAVDLMVYLAKYRTWLGDQSADPGFGGLSDSPEAANSLIAYMVDKVVLLSQPETTTELEDWLRLALQNLMDSAAEGEESVGRAEVVMNMHERATILAMRRWRETPALFARPLGEDDYLGADHE